MSSITNDDNRIIKKTIEIREKIMDDLLVQGLPKTEEDRKFLLEVINSTDRTILTKAKIKSDDAGNSNAAKMQKTIAEILLKAGSASQRARSNIPSLPSDIESDAVSGQTIIGDDAMTYSEFKSK